MTEIQEKVNTFQAILIPKFFSGKIIQEFNEIFDHSKQKIESLQTYCEMIKSENTLEMYQGLIYTKKYVLIKRNKQSIIFELNTVQNIIHIIEYNENQLVLYEALWILGNLTCEPTQIIDKIIENDSINCLVRKFSTEYYHDQIIEQVCWIIAYVTVDNFKYRDYMIQLEIIKILNNYAIERVKDFENLAIIEPLVWSIKNCFEFEQILLLKDIEVSLTIFQNWIKKQFPVEILLYICESFAIYVQSHPSKIQTIIDFGIIPKIIELAEHENQQLFLANIQILQSILESHQVHQKYLRSIDIIPCLRRLINKFNELPICIKYGFITFIMNFGIFLCYKSFRISKSMFINSNELDQLLQLINFHDNVIQEQVKFVIRNLIEEHQNIDNLNLIQIKIFIQLCQVFIARNQKEQRNLRLFQIILNICDKYLKDELLKLKQIVQKLNNTNNLQI